MPHSTRTSALREIVIVVAMTLVISFVLKTFFIQAFFIPSGSMENTLVTDDRIIVNKLTASTDKLHHGDIVVFKDPGGWLTNTPVPPGQPAKAIRDVLAFTGILPQDAGEHLVKRVIGLPGDTVACCNASGQVTINGVGIDEKAYLFPGNAPSDAPFGPVTVPAGKLWVMGDHRRVSGDSRAHKDVEGGFVSQDLVVGQAVLLMWPLGKFGSLASHPEVFAKVPAPSAASR